MWLLAATTIWVTLALVFRHSQLHRISRQRASLVAASSIGVLGRAALLGIAAKWDSALWWAAHGIDVAAVGGARGLRRASANW